VLLKCRVCGERRGNASRLSVGVVVELLVFFFWCGYAFVLFVAIEQWLTALFWRCEHVGGASSCKVVPSWELRMLHGRAKRWSSTVLKARSVCLSRVQKAN
jgi:hypothetical protein